MQYLFILGGLPIITYLVSLLFTAVVSIVYFDECVDYTISKGMVGNNNKSWVIVSMACFLTALLPIVNTFTSIYGIAHCIKDITGWNPSSRIN